MTKRGIDGQIHSCDDVIRNVTDVEARANLRANRCRQEASNLVTGIWTGLIQAGIERGALVLSVKAPRVKGATAWTVDQRRRTPRNRDEFLIGGLVQSWNRAQQAPRVRVFRASEQFLG